MSEGGSWKSEAGSRKPEVGVNGHLKMVLRNITAKLLMSCSGVVFVALTPRRFSWYNGPDFPVISCLAGVEGMYSDLDRVLVPARKIENRVAELGRMISEDYAGTPQLLTVGILKGSAIFMADLVRAISVPVTFDFMAVASYGQSSFSSGVVRILKDLEQPIAGRDVLLVEDTADTGLTLNYLLETLRARNPASLRVCALLDKPGRHLVEVSIDYLGFTIPDEFVVGYGMDYSELYRNLPEVWVLKAEVYQRDS
jgi:hypoxanthine phosphoribosyltransferase